MKEKSISKDAINRVSTDIKQLPEDDALSLPKGWEWKKLGEVCEILDKKRKPITKKYREKGSFPYYGATGILDYVKHYIFDEQLVLLGEDGAKWQKYQNSAYIIEGKSWVNNHAHVLRPKRNILHDFWLKYNLNMQDLMPFVSGLTVPKLNQSNMKLIPIPLPPLPEQQRIVAILDEAFAAIDEAKANAEKNLANAKELFESYLNGIFANPGEDWEEKKLGEITHKIGSGATPTGGKKSYKDNGISLIRSLNVHDYEFNYDNLAFIDESQANKLLNVTVKSKDVLLNITGASIARCNIVPDDILPARVNQHVSIIRLKPNTVLPEFLHYMLISKPHKEKLLFTGDKNGATRQALTKTLIENFRITYPEINKQEAILKKIKSMKTESIKLKKIFEQKITALDELKKSILKKAFEGKL